MLLSPKRGPLARLGGGVVGRELLAFHGGSSSIDIGPRAGIFQRFMALCGASTSEHMAAQAIDAKGRKSIYQFSNYTAD